MRTGALLVIAVTLVPLQAIARQEEGLDTTLHQVQSLVARHRYQDVVSLLQPLLDQATDPEDRYIISAELGRSCFHLGRYQEALAHLRRAVALRPQRVETALYLLAACYVTGDHQQALSILRQVLDSGARDLYPAVTLPGERSFLADPRVWAILDEHTVTLPVDLPAGSVLGVRLGADRQAVADALGAPAEAASGPFLTARAGPYPIWSWGFSATGLLREVVLYNENLVKYTPYRVQLGDLEWTATPAAAIASLGPPAATADEEGGLAMSWEVASARLTLTFGAPRPPRPPAIGDGAAMLLAVRMTVADPGDDGDFGSIGP